MPPLKDLTGQKFGRWLVIGHADGSLSGAARWLCRCECGVERSVLYSNLRKGISKGCGCRKQHEDLTGRRFGRLTVIAEAGKRRSGVYLWECRCDCGGGASVVGAMLRNGHTKSCGCLMREVVGAMNLKHGHARLTSPQHPLYDTWLNMNQRCSNPKNPGYPNYGGRGISVCRAWRDSFERFLVDVGERPSKDHSLDRIDNDGHYEPGNVRWATRVRQNRNARSNRILEFNGQAMCVNAWAERLGISTRTLQGRLRRGWPTEKALAAPVQTHKRNRNATT